MYMQVLPASLLYRVMSKHCSSSFWRNSCGADLTVSDNRQKYAWKVNVKSEDKTVKIQDNVFWFDTKYSFINPIWGLYVNAQEDIGESDPLLHTLCENI